MAVYDLEMMVRDLERRKVSPRQVKDLPRTGVASSELLNWYYTSAKVIPYGWNVDNTHAVQTSSVREARRPPRFVTLLRSLD